MTARTDRAVDLVRTICEATADLTIELDPPRHRAKRNWLSRALEKKDGATLFDWLIHMFSYQGVSDAAANSYIEKHGNATYREIEDALAVGPDCTKLAGFRAYTGCRYRKNSRTCANKRLLKGCPVPSHDLRNGTLNQLAYSLFFFLRDRARGDLADFIDRELAAADQPGHPDRVAHMRDRLLGAFVEIHGLSYKVVSMTLSDLLLAADPSRSRWVETGGSMIAIDTLVHNFMVRTGGLIRLAEPHSYGPACYRDGGCMALIDWLARRIDARAFAPAGPIYFPRLIQYAIWAYCAQQGLNICNSNKIDDAAKCRQRDCAVFAKCPRIPLAAISSEAITKKRSAKSRSPP